MKNEKLNLFFTKIGNIKEAEEETGEEEQVKTLFDIDTNERPENDQYEGYEDFFDYVNQSGLSFDFVEAGTFEGQSVGYWRFQMSWGGPSDEFRIYTDYDKNINYIEYWYMDWFDGASIRVNDDIIHHICQMFLECSNQPDPSQYYLDEYAEA